MKSQLSLLLLFSIILTAFSGCLKKGEDDPLISLRTRKARLVKSWEIESGTYESKNDQSYVGAGINLLKIIYTDRSRISTSEIINSSGSFKNTNEVPFIYTLEFKKNGEFISTMISDYSQSLVISGTWNFTSGVGKHKNKDQVVMHVSSMKGDYNISAYSGNRTDYTYTVKELRNKKLVLTSEHSQTDEPPGYSFSSK